MAFAKGKSAELHLLNSIISIPLKIEIMEFNKGKIGKPLNLVIAQKDLSDTPKEWLFPQGKVLKGSCPLVGKVLYTPNLTQFLE